MDENLKRFVIVEYGVVVGIVYAEQAHGKTWVESDTAQVGDDVKFDAPLMMPNLGGGGGPIEP